MKKCRFFLVFFLLLAGCKTNEVQPTTQDLLTANQWKLDRFSDSSRKTLSASQVSIEANLLAALLFEFRSDFVTRAREASTKQIVNAGSWALVENDKIMDIDVAGFKGRFTILEISKTKLVLRDDNKKLLKNQDNGNLEFVVVL